MSMQQYGLQTGRPYLRLWWLLLIAIATPDYSHAIVDNFLYNILVDAGHTESMTDTHLRAFRRSNINKRRQLINPFFQSFYINSIALVNRTSINESFGVRSNLFLSSMTSRDKQRPLTIRYSCTATHT